ncbi:alanine racemase [Micromonospora sonneratiae]|uniref:Alanine racemase n=1 Tax=Micromonospora sonneratiae TaxID=1184706 RepID=A0ABW3YB76_9ACTN
MIKYGGTEPSPPLAETIVDLDAIAHNTRLLAAQTNATMLAVVKANAFGHGVQAVTRTVLDAGAQWLGVTSRAEALELRDVGITAPILSWLHAPDEDFAPVITADVDLSAASVDHLVGIAASARRIGIPANVHLKADTGLSRGGATDRNWPELVSQARSLEQAGLIRVRGVWSHLANAEQPDHPSVAGQIHEFKRALTFARATGLSPEVTHLANSAALIGVPEAHFDLVRAGIALYGPEPMTDRTVGLRATMTLRSRVILTKRVPAGTGVSYGHDYTTSHETTLVLVSIGFADGVPRCAGSRAEVWIRGRRCPIAGRIAMDQFVADVGDLPVRTGDEVLVFGTGERGEPTVTEWAGWAGTNPHEILTGIGARVSRRYLPVRSGQTTERERVNA